MRPKHRRNSWVQKRLAAKFGDDDMILAECFVEEYPHVGEEQCVEEQEERRSTKHSVVLNDGGGGDLDQDCQSSPRAKRSTLMHAKRSILLNADQPVVLNLNPKRSSSNFRNSHSIRNSKKSFFRGKSSVLSTKSSVFFNDRPSTVVDEDDMASGSSSNLQRIEEEDEEDDDDNIYLRDEWDITDDSDSETQSFKEFAEFARFRAKSMNPIARTKNRKSAFLDVASIHDTVAIVGDGFDDRRRQVVTQILDFACDKLGCAGRDISSA